MTCKGPLSSVQASRCSRTIKHLFEHRSRRLNVRHALLHRPWPEAGYVDASPDGDGKVLMPGHLPVGIRRLVEEEALNGEGVRAEDRLDQPAEGPGVSDVADERRDSHQVTDGVERPKPTGAVCALHP
jgi:hypothetical protein